jgi:NADH-quinone oxidoreductase subunit N
VTMTERLPFLWPEITLFLTTCVVMVLGLSPNLSTRRLCGPFAGLGLLVAGIVAALNTDPAPGPMPHLVAYVKVVVAAVGLLLLLLQAGTVDREEEREIAAGVRAFNPLRTVRAEFYAFFLFSLTGLMLCATATDLIWLFLALELTSLPTYIMVTISTRSSKSQEAGVKYFFLGALGAAIFLYGFSLIYGGTGHTDLAKIAWAISSGGLNPITLTGLMLAVIGVSFKIAAVPMHFYTPDVYEGAAAPVSAFLAFVPKAAGFISIILLLSTVGWQHGPSGGSLPEALRLMLWIMAALTMTVGNVLALLQTSVKRILAYSSIAHSGYMLVGIIAGPGTGDDAGSFTRSGLAAVLFYLLAYGVMNVGAFAVVACLERRSRDGGHEEADTVDDLRGLCATRPILGWTMVLSSLSLLGMPPLLGFFGKLPLFSSAISAGEIPLVIVLGLNSAIAAYYYLRLAAAPLLAEPGVNDGAVHHAPFATRRLAGLISAVAVVILMLAGDRLIGASEYAARFEARRAPVVVPAGEGEHAGTANTDEPPGAEARANGER